MRCARWSSFVSEPVGLGSKVLFRTTFQSCMAKMSGEGEGASEAHLPPSLLRNRLTLGFMNSAQTSSSHSRRMPSPLCNAERDRDRDRERDRERDHKDLSADYDEMTGRRDSACRVLSVCVCVCVCVCAVVPCLAAGKRHVESTANVQGQEA